MHKTWLTLCLLLATPPVHASPPSTPVEHLIRGMAHRSPAIVAQARARYEQVPLAQRRAGLERALAQTLPPAQRRFCATELGRIADTRSAPALMRLAVRDPVVSVRKAATKALRACKSATTVRQLVRGLDSSSLTHRIRTANALGALGDVSAVPHILVRWDMRSGNFPRAHFTQVNQISYVQDFDVEVAATAFIADPIVGTLQDGLVNDVRVLSTEVVMTTRERVSYVRALSELTGAHYGARRKKWHAWWRNYRDHAAQPTPPTTPRR